jgi:sugar phosphate isomerase/epimerase
MAIPAGTVLLGTVALEPNRWGTVEPSGAPTTIVSRWLDGIAAAGFDGIELWERHATSDPVEATAILAGPLPVTLWNTYASFDEVDPTERERVAGWVRRCRSRGVKFNVGPDPAQLDLYAERLASWVALLPEDAVALCECHAGISVAERPEVAAALFAAAGPADRVQAIVHSHESAEHLAARFDAYGERITHVHVNHLDPATGRAPRLAERAAELAATAAHLRSLGFRGSWTVEFVHGTLTDRDRPAELLAQAAEDLKVLREILGGAGA